MIVGARSWFRKFKEMEVPESFSREREAQVCEENGKLDLPMIVIRGKKRAKVTYDLILCSWRLSEYGRGMVSELLSSATGYRKNLLAGGIYGFSESMSLEDARVVAARLKAIMSLAIARDRREEARIRRTR